MLPHRCLRSAGLACVLAFLVSASLAAQTAVAALRPLAVLLSHDGRCVVASAGHPSPFLNRRELSLPGALPLGVAPNAVFQESAHQLEAGDHLALYTDGVLEARSPAGEIFGFERLNALFARGPAAAEATGAAVRFGQEDDITVLTITRLAKGQQSTTELTIPIFAEA
jgi:hypothetical protein